MLSAAMKLHRPPNMCVLVDAAPEGITAAHNCTMKAIAVPGRFKAYQLTQADLTCTSLASLTVFNIRKLFANQGQEFMDLKHGYSNEQPPNRRRVTSCVI
jgi:beta-phosphoglucomutase-like phosphatase (HAD superfamily)